MRALISWEGLHFGASDLQFWEDDYAWQVQHFVWPGLTFSWQAQYFRQVEWKNRKMHRYEAVSSALNFPPGATKKKHRVLRLVDLFAPGSSFFSRFFFSDSVPPLLFHVSILSEVWLLKFVDTFCYILLRETKNKPGRECKFVARLDLEYLRMCSNEFCKQRK